MNNYSKKRTAQLLLCSLLLESCYNPNIGTGKKTLPAPAAPTYQQGQYEQKPHDKPPGLTLTTPDKHPIQFPDHPRQPQAVVRSQDHAPATTQPLPRPGREGPWQQRVHDKYKRAHQVPSKRALCLRNQHELLRNQRAAQAERQASEAIAAKPASQPAPPTQLRPAIIPPPPRPTPSPSFEDQVPPGTLRQTYLAKGGHQVNFIHQDGQWWARVNEHLPIGFTRRIDLPVYCEPGLCVAEVDQHDQTWHKHRIHVCFPEKTPDQRGYVYVGSMGLKGGGGDRPNCGKWTGDWIPDGCGGRGCWGHPPNRHSSRSSSQGQNAALGSSSSDQNTGSRSVQGGSCTGGWISPRERSESDDLEYEREYNTFRDRIEEIQKEFGEEIHINNIQQARQIKAQLQEHIDFLEERGPFTKVQEGNLRTLRQCYADADRIEQAYADAERYERFREDQEKSLQQDCDELNRLQDAQAEPAVIIAKAEAIKLHVQAAINSVEQYSTRQSKAGLLTGLRETQQKLDEIIRDFTKSKILDEKFRKAVKYVAQFVCNQLKTKEAQLSNQVGYAITEYKVLILPRSGQQKCSLEQMEGIFLDDDIVSVEKLSELMEITAVCIGTGAEESARIRVNPGGISISLDEENYKTFISEINQEIQSERVPLNRLLEAAAAPAAIDRKSVV